MVSSPVVDEPRCCFQAAGCSLQGYGPVWPEAQRRWVAAALSEVPATAPQRMAAMPDSGCSLQPAACSLRARRQSPAAHLLHYPAAVDVKRLTGDEAGLV
jgi:hypothetical protein